MYFIFIFVVNLIYKKAEFSVVITTLLAMLISRLHDEE